MATTRQWPDAGLPHHSDQGRTYASEDYLKTLAAVGITCSAAAPTAMTVAKSFFSTVKSELADR